MGARFFPSCGRGCRLFLLLLLLWGFFPLSSHTQSTPAVYVFGGSLNDVGNNNYLNLSPLKANFPHNGIDYPGSIPTGRFSNGKNLADFIAKKLGLATSPPYLSLSRFETDAYLTGVSFASGGAGILDTTNKGRCLTFDVQIEYFKKVRASLLLKLGDVGLTKHLSRSIFMVTIGSNDFIDNQILLGYSVRPNVTLQRFVDELIVKLKGQFRTIYDLGARKVAFIGTLPIGCTPGLRVKSQNGDCDDNANNWSMMFNAGVSSLLQEMKTTLSDFSFSFSDAYAALMQILSSPSSYGFTELKAACCGRGKLNALFPCLPVAAYCSNRETYLFWDFAHPTQALAGKLMDKYFEGSSPVVYPLNIRQLASLAV